MDPVPVMQDSYTGEVDTARSFIVKVYMWMALGLFLTAIVSAAPFAILGEAKFAELIAENIIIIFGLMILEFLIVLGLSFLINKIPAVLAFAAFIIYALL